MVIILQKEKPKCRKNSVETMLPSLKQFYMDSQSASAVTIYVRYLSAPPSFTNRLPARKNAKEREVLVLTCNVSGNPTPSVTWYKDGRALVEDSQTHFYRSAFEHKLVVNNPAGGVYQCETENTYGSSIDQTIVNVIGELSTDL
jgi:hypothetical protein